MLRKYRKRSFLVSDYYRFFQELLFGVFSDWTRLVATSEMQLVLSGIQSLERKWRKHQHWLKETLSSQRASTPSRLETANRENYFSAVSTTGRVLVCNRLTSRSRENRKVPEPACSCRVNSGDVTVQQDDILLEEIVSYLNAVKPVTHLHEHSESLWSIPDRKNMPSLRQRSVLQSYLTYLMHSGWRETRRALTLVFDLIITIRNAPPSPPSGPT